MSPKEPEPILRPSRYFLPTRSSILAVLLFVWLSYLRYCSIIVVIVYLLLTAAELSSCHAAAVITPWRINLFGIMVGVRGSRC